MSLVFDRYPGEWHGNKSISLVFSHLNKMYKPVPNFEICLFGDESIYYDKIERKAYSAALNYMKSQRSKIETLSEER